MRRYARTSILMLLPICLVSAVRAEIVTKSVPYTVGNDEFIGFLAYDDKATEPRPGVLVVHEWWGLNDFAKERATQLAKMGYVAFAADMYGKGESTDSIPKAAGLSGALKGKPALRERAKGALDTLAKQPGVDAKRLAAIGFCFGGTTCLELAYSGADLAGIVSFHGGLTNPQPGEAEKIKARILILHGNSDSLIPTKAVIDLEKALREGKANWQMIQYGGAKHSFTNPAADKLNMPGVGYDATTDKRSLQHMKLFFDEIFTP